MQGEREVLKSLNTILTCQLSAINQYFLHARILKDWGYDVAAKTIYKESITQMKLAEKTTDRLLLLEGLPNYQKYLKLNIGEDVEEIFRYDNEYCVSGIDTLREMTKVCLEHKDHVSRDLLESFLVSEENHLDSIEIQRKILGESVIKNYLAEQL